MKVVWINPRFLHYRVPVYKALNEMLNNNLTVIFSATRTPVDVQSNITKVLGERAVALEGERISTFGRNDSGFSNISIHIPYQPGLVKAISTVRPDTIIAEGFFQWTPAAIWAGISGSIPLVVAYERTIHTERNAGWIRTSYRRVVAKRVDAICCNGRLSKEYCTKVLGFPENRIVTGAMAADSDTISKALKDMKADDIITMEKAHSLARPVYLYVGRLVRGKGLRELLSAWEKHNANSPATGSLLIVGDGPERQYLEQTVHDHRLLNVFLIGNVDYSRIVPYYAIADILVMPTLEDNWSLVVPEAMECGKPILCSKYNGCWPELVRDGINGYVFDPLDIDSFSLLLNKFGQNQRDIIAMGEASYDIIKSFTPQKAAEACLEACQIACSRP